ncbi:MAG: iron transporter [Clostridiales Family XIII bacterium]|jgi:uncharacterized protein involved in high-affinity Fe2+ transport|nr:iron transporter [Clostridiales Family XIII bacterium]
MKIKKILALFLMLCIAALSLAACGGGGGGNENADDSDGPGGDVGPGGVAGFEEFPIGDDQQLGPLNVAGVYFQPVDMEPAGMGLAAADSDFHIEADISAAEGNNLGYGVGDFVPWLKVDYEIEDSSGNLAGEGTFMPMSASDGPHYGANVALPNAGTYMVRFIITSPESQGYLLHTDDVTGVTGRFWSEPLVAEWEFNYTPREW